MTFLKQNPGVLLDLMPDNVDFDFRNDNQDFEHIGHSMIPDLGVVPPQSGQINKKIKDDNSMYSHYRKHSLGDSKFSADSYKNRGLLPIKQSLSKLANGDKLMEKPHNTPSSSNKLYLSNYSKPSIKPNTATKAVNDYQTPSFLTSNIVNTVNKTVYKV